MFCPLWAGSAPGDRLRGQAPARIREGAIVADNHPLIDRASLTGLRRQIRAELKRAGVDPADSFDCLVAVTEACTNALTHGLGPDGHGPRPEVWWDIRPDCALFYVRDFSGRQWSMASHPSRFSGPPPDGPDERIGGYGMAIMRDLMDDVGFSIGREGTTVVLRKDLR